MCPVAQNNLPALETETVAKVLHTVARQKLRARPFFGPALIFSGLVGLLD